MTRTKVETMADQRRAPPPPPPRGVTLRSPSAVIAPSGAFGTAHPPSSIATSASTSAVNRLPFKTSNAVAPNAIAPTIKPVMKEHVPAELSAGLSVVQQQHHPQGYLETRYAYSVNGILGSAAQASAAAAFFARASQKLNLASPQRRKRHGSSDGAESPIPAAVHRFGTDFSGLLRRNPPPPPPHLLRRLGLRENPGVGKVRVMLRVAGDPTTSNFLSVDKKRKQLTLQEPGNHSSLTLASSSSSEKEHQVGAEDRRVGVAAPKMFAFDGLFTAADNSQGDVAASVLSDIVTAVINGSDGCVFCFGHAQLGKTTTMVGSCSEDIGPGLMPTAIAWLFRGIGEQKNKTGARFSVRVSAVEIAGPAEVLRDLLAPHATESEESPGVYLRDDPLLGTQLQNQSELRAPTAEKAAFYLDAALAARTDASSPDARFSHLLYTLHVYQYSVDRNPSRTGSSGHATGGSAGSGVAGGRSRLHLLDLGSCQQTGRPNGNGQSSANNMTLSGLGNVLVALFNGQRHLPHREHKITQVLRECLGSLTCQAALVAHVAASSAYSETLSTVQMASRVHRMRRRRMKQYNNAGSGGSGSGGSSEDSSRLGLSRSSGGESSTGGSADPSSSEQSCDTVIYVGPIDDATDGEHPPVYLPSLNSGDHRCSMSRALRGSTVDRPAGQQQSNRSPVHHAKKESPTPVAPSRSPQIQRKVAKCEPIQQSSKQSGSVAGSSNEEQWIDGPRFNKTRISQARMQVVRHQREMWVDGPPTDAAQVLPTPAVLPTVTPTVNQAPLGYGFMDQHKQGMIRQWVENQSVQQRHPPVRTNGQMWIDAQPRPAPEPGTPVKVLTVFKTCPDDEDESKEVDNATPAENTRSPRVNRHPVPVKQSRRKAESSLTEEVTISSNPKQPPEEKLNCLSGVSGANIESVEPTASSLTLEQLYSQCEQLADSLVQEEEHVAVEDSSTDEASDDLSAALDVTSEQVSISCDSWRRVRHRDEDDNTTVTEFKVSEAANQRGRHASPMHGRGGDYSPEYIEVEEPDEPVPTQDSCLQVTEEDIAFSMMEALEAKCNDTRSLCSFGDGEEHPLRALSHDNLTIISHFTGETYSQGTACEWEPIASSIFDPMPSSSAMENAEFYQTQLEQLAKLHQQIYQQSVAGNAAGTLHPTPLSALTNCNIGSFKDLPLLTQDWNNVAVRTSPGRNGLGQETRKAMVSTIGMELERELGIQDANQAALLSSLRHPDGASDPHLDQHSGKAYESSRSCELQQQQQERLPGNGASNSDPEEEMAIKSNAIKTAATMANLIPEREQCKSFNEENSVEHEKVIHHKTPKLSRFFSGSKNKQQSSSITKRNTATSTVASPIPTPKATSSAKASPKVEKRSKSRENTSKHNSPAKSLSKSPSRIDPTTSVSIPPSPKSQSSKSSNKKDKLKASSSHKSPKKDLKINWDGKSSGSKRDVKSYGFSYESCQQTAPSSLCPSEGYESGGSDSGVHLSAASPIKSRRHAQQIQQQQQIRRQHLMPIGEMSRKNFSSGTSTSGSGGSGGSAGHYESSGYESVIRDSECSSLGSSSQDSDREAHPLALAISTGKQPATIGQSSSCTIL